MRNIPNLFLKLAAANGFLVVLLGAFGAHALENMVSPQSLNTWHTAVQYHMFHVGGFLAVSLAEKLFVKTPALYWSGISFLCGTLLFSGSLYLLALTNHRALGMVTPVGGVLFLLGWGLLFKGLLSRKV